MRSVELLAYIVMVYEGMGLCSYGYIVSATCSHGPVQLLIYTVMAGIVLAEIVTAYVVIAMACTGITYRLWPA